eukprot:3252042-Amphidinium_carterae.2
MMILEPKRVTIAMPWSFFIHIGSSTISLGTARQFGLWTITGAPSTAAADNGFIVVEQATILRHTHNDGTTTTMKTPRDNEPQAAQQDTMTSSSESSTSSTIPMEAMDNAQPVVWRAQSMHSTMLSSDT